MKIKEIDISNAKIYKNYEGDEYKGRVFKIKEKFGYIIMQITKIFPRTLRYRIIEAVNSKGESKFIQDVQDCQSIFYITNPDKNIEYSVGKEYFKSCKKKELFSTAYCRLLKNENKK